MEGPPDLLRDLLDLLDLELFVDFSRFLLDDLECMLLLFFFSPSLPSRDLDRCFLLRLPDLDLDLDPLVFLVLLDLEAVLSG